MLLLASTLNNHGMPIVSILMGWLAVHSTLRGILSIHHKVYVVHNCSDQGCSHPDFLHPTCQEDLLEASRLVCVVTIHQGHPHPNIQSNEWAVIITQSFFLLLDILIPINIGIFSQLQRLVKHTSGLIGKLCCVIGKLKKRSVCMQRAFLLFCCWDEKLMHANYI